MKTSKYNIYLFDILLFHANGPRGKGRHVERKQTSHNSRLSHTGDPSLTLRMTIGYFLCSNDKEMPRIQCGQKTIKNITLK